MQIVTSTVQVLCTLAEALVHDRSWALHQEPIVLRSGVLAMVTGVRYFGNDGTCDFGNVVTATVNPTRFMIPVGCADPIPMIVVSFSDTVAAE